MADEPTTADLRFLIGEWQGTGTLRGAPLTSRYRGSEFLDHFLQVEVEAFAGGECVHRERVLYYPDDGGTGALSLSAEGRAWRWRVTADAERRRFELLHRPPAGQPAQLRWTLERRADGTLRELFDLVDPAPGAPALVELVHRPVDGAP